MSKVKTADVSQGRAKLRTKSLGQRILDNWQMLQLRSKIFAKISPRHRTTYTRTGGFAFANSRLFVPEGRKIRLFCGRFKVLVPP